MNQKLIRKSVAVKFPLPLWIAALLYLSAIAKCSDILETALHFPELWTLSDTTVVLLIAVEVLLATWALASPHSKNMAIVLMSIFSAFALHNAWTLLSGHRVSCDCFGSAISMPPIAMLLIDLAVVALLAVYLRRVSTQNNRPVVASWPRAAVSSAAFVGIAVLLQGSFGPTELAVRYAHDPLRESHGQIFVRNRTSSSIRLLGARQTCGYSIAGLPADLGVSGTARFTLQFPNDALIEVPLCIFYFQRGYPTKLVCNKVPAVRILRQSLKRVGSKTPGGLK